MKAEGDRKQEKHPSTSGSGTTSKEEWGNKHAGRHRWVMKPIKSEETGELESEFAVDGIRSMALAWRVAQGTGESHTFTDVFVPGLRRILPQGWRCAEAAAMVARSCLGWGHADGAKRCSAYCARRSRLRLPGCQSNSAM